LREKARMTDGLTHGFAPAKNAITRNNVIADIERSELA